MSKCLHLKRSAHAFTLIELMIVVVIIGIISAVIIPKLFSYQENTSDLPQLTQKSTTGAPPKALSEALNTIIPTTNSADIDVKLVTSSYIHNLAVYTTYDANFNGDFVFSNTHENNENIRLYFPFPPDTTQASNVSLKVLKNENYSEPEKVQYTLEGINWQGTLKKGHLLQVKVEYKAQGYNRYIYDGPGAGRAGTFKLRLNLEGLNSKYIPAETLKPTLTEPQYLVWDFENLVTDRKIIVELPGVMSPMGRIILLAKLAGFAVFLFGLAFIYFSDLKQPGCLDNFRWGHFLLLALNYFLFFIIFMIMTLSGDIQTWVSILISALISLPLLMLHVSRILGKTFAFKYILPMTIYTLAIVFSGVYGGNYRNYLFIALAVIAITFFTLSYKTWSEKRREFSKSKQLQFESDLKLQEKNKLLEKRQKELQKTRESIQKKLGDSINHLKNTLRTAEKKQLHINLVLDDNSAHGDNTEYQWLINRHSQFEELNQNSLQLFDQQLQIEQQADHEQHRDLCNALLVEVSRMQQKLTITIDQNEVRLNHFKRFIDQFEQQHDKNQSACIACGFSSPSSSYCPQCGVQRALEIECKHCNVVYRHPIHLLIDDLDVTQLHCMSCGHQLDKE